MINTVNGKVILTVNAGSSSVKFALFTSNSEPDLQFTGRIERVGKPDAIFVLDNARGTNIFNVAAEVTDFAAAASLLAQWLKQQGSDELYAIGHRFVHGGPDYYQPQLLTPVLMTALHQLVSFAPEHLPQEILLAEALGEYFPAVPQIVCFDTAFHHALPPVAKILPIPRKYQAEGVRRYGFHGLSYEFLLAELRRTEGETATRGRLILAHLGNGASLAAVSNEQPQDTSMGFTPAAGVPMGTRTGDVDPGLLRYLSRTGLDAAEIDHLVNFESGLLGVSGISADMRDLLAREADAPAAAEAIALFCYQIKKWIGAFAAALGGVDRVVFTGGIGENCGVVRARICTGLDFLGVELDAELNKNNAAIISANAARTRVHVIKTNEELVIARSVSRVLAHADLS